MFYSGDSGYGPHFAEIGERFGGVDLAIMENGQYDPNWKNIHMMPEEAARGAADLRAMALLPAHSGRFTISNHAWDDPYKRACQGERRSTLPVPDAQDRGRGEPERTRPNGLHPGGRRKLPVRNEATSWRTDSRPALYHAGQIRDRTRSRTGGGSP